MRLFSKRSRSDDLTIFFATDVHGSEICFKKFLGAPDFYGADICILGGDMTGKMVVPIVEEGNDAYSASIAGRDVTVSGEEDVGALEAKVRDAGFYPYRTTPDELSELSGNPDRVDKIFHDEMKRTLER